MVESFLLRHILYKPILRPQDTKLHAISTLTIIKCKFVIFKTRLITFILKKKMTKLKKDNDKKQLFKANRCVDSIGLNLKKT